MAKQKRRRRVSDFRLKRREDRHGVAWFEPSDYARMLEITNYPEGVTRDYEVWRAKAEGEESYWKGRGSLVVRVPINPDAFVAWCSARTLEPNFKSVPVFVQHRTIGYPP